MAAVNVAAVSDAAIDVAAVNEAACNDAVRDATCETIVRAMLGFIYGVPFSSAGSFALAGTTVTLQRWVRRPWSQKSDLRSHAPSQKRVSSPRKRGPSACDRSKRCTGVGALSSTSCGSWIPAFAGMTIPFFGSELRACGFPLPPLPPALASLGRGCGPPPPLLRNGGGKAQCCATGACTYRRILAPLEESASCEDLRHRLLDPRRPRRGLLRVGE